MGAMYDFFLQKTPFLKSKNDLKLVFTSLANQLCPLGIYPSSSVYTKNASNLHIQLTDPLVHI